MAMDTMTTLYISLAGFMFVGLALIVLVVSGKSIIYDFYRRINPKGVDVFMMNSNRQLSHHYKTPKDGIIRIGKKLYVSNPDKLTSLSDDMKKEAVNSIKEKMNRFKGRIAHFDRKIERVQKELIKLSDAPANEGVKSQYLAHIETLKQKKKIIEDKMDDREQVYYHNRRGAFLFIEGDPIPKDFHEWYTDMDSISIDNVIARSMTKDPKAVRDMEKEIKTMKFLLVVTLIAAAAAAIVAVTLKTDIQTIAQSIGVTLTVI